MKRIHARLAITRKEKPGLMEMSLSTHIGQDKIAALVAYNVVSNLQQT